MYVCVWINKPIKIYGMNLRVMGIGKKNERGRW